LHERIKRKNYSPVNVPWFRFALPGPGITLVVVVLAVSGALPSSASAVCASTRESKSAPLLHSEQSP
jgi:hypothetical protein